MKETKVLNVEKRDSIGGRSSRRLLRDGYIPAILYGKEIRPEHLKIKRSDFNASMSKYGSNTIFEISLPGKNPTLVIVKDKQSGHLKDEIVHIDLQQISLTEEIKVDVPIRIIGRELVEAARCVVVQQMDSVSVKCLPQNAPEHIEIDVSKIPHGGNITAGELELPKGVSLDTDAEQIILSLSEARESAVVEEEKEETVTDMEE